MAILTKAANEPLALSEVQAFFGRLYPTGIDAFALENVDGIALSTGNTDSGTQTGWSNDAFEYYAGQVNYVAQTPSADFIGITRNPGATIQITSGRVWARFRVTTFTPTATRRIGIEIRETGGTQNGVRWRGGVDVDAAGSFELNSIQPEAGANFWNFNTTLEIRMFAENTQPNEIILVDLTSLQVNLRTGTQYNRSVDRLSAYARGGGVVPVWPEEGGLAITWDNPVRHTLPDDDDNDLVWPTAPPTTIAGIGTDWTYNVPSVFSVATRAAGDTNNFGSFVNNGSTFFLGSNAVATIDITIFDNSPESSPNPTFIFSKIDSSGNYVSNAASNSFRLRNHAVTFSRQTINIPLTSIFNVANGEGIRFYITETASSDTPFDFMVHGFTISPTATVFSEINTNVSEDGTTIQLSQLRNVDDGRTAAQQQSGGSQ